jgi:hypothetical protein
LNTRRTPQAINQASTKQAAKAPKAIKDSGRAKAINKPIGSTTAVLLMPAMKVSFSQ